MNNQVKLLLLIVALVAGAIWAVATKPIRKGLDIQGGMRVVLRAKIEDPSFTRKKTKWTQEHLETVARIMRNRVDALGVSEQVVYPQGTDRIVVELPGVRNKDEALRVIQQTASLEFRKVTQFENGTWRHEDETKDGVSTGYEKIVDSAGKEVSEAELNDKIFSTEPVLTGGELLPNAKAELGGDGYFINFEFRDDAKRVFEEFTRGNINKPLAIFLDKKLISAPNINDVIPGKGIIEGRFTADQAKTLANQLNAGALPVPLEQIEQFNVEATLGSQAVRQTTMAGIAGLALVLVFMLAYYRGPGTVACIALLLYTLFNFAIFVLVPVTLTVPGIAGFILSIGMAVDANILIFERMKEERRSGKSIRGTVETGFRRAFSAIFDTNACTLITCGILYHFGTGQVRGFAVTLAIGVLLSMFSAITVSRTFLMLLSNTALGQREGFYRVPDWHPTLNVSRRMALWFGISAVSIVPGLLFWGMGGIKPSIEFTGGTEMTVQFQQPPTVNQITQILRSKGQEEARVLLAEGNRAFVTTRQLTDTQASEVAGAYRAAGGEVQQTMMVSGLVSRELTQNAITAVLIASALIVIFLAFRFAIPNFVEGLKYGVCAVGAMLHDAAFVWGFMAIMGYFMNWQIDGLFVTAMLTIIGFSMHDTVVIFDRLRENLHHRQRGETFADVADRSIDQTFARSVNTSIATMLPLVAMLILGGPTIRMFIAALLLGVISGTYSSIFNAAPLLVLWKRMAGERAMLPATAGGPAPRPAPRPQPQRPAQPTKPKPAQPPGPNGDGAGTAEIPAEEGTIAAGGADRVKPKKKRRRM